MEKKLKEEKLSLFFDQACTISLYALLFSIPISSALIESFFWVSLLFFGGRVFTSGGLFAQILKKEKILLFFFVALELSLINSGPFLTISLHALVLKWGEYIALYLIVSQTLISTPRIKGALASLTWGAILIILDCFSQLFFNLEILRHRHMVLHDNTVWALNGPFKHNNDLAAYLICMLIIILYWVFSKSSPMIKSIAVSVFFLGIFILIHAYSRGGWISFILAIMLLAIFLKKFRFLGVALLMTVVSFKFIFLKSLLLHDDGRLKLWEISLNMIKAHPLLGNGIGTFMAWFRSFSPTGCVSYAHNCFLQLWAEAGLISLVIFLFFIFKILKRGIAGYKENKNPVFLILSCAIIAFLCHSSVDTFFFSYQLASLLWVMMALLQGSVTAQGSERLNTLN